MGQIKALFAACLLLAACGHQTYSYTDGSGGVRNTASPITVKVTLAQAQSTQKFAIYPLVGPIAEEEAPFFVSWLATAVNPTVIIHSLGGSMSASIAIMTAIHEHGGVTCIVDGYAGSGAFGILQSCKVRKMTRVSSLMTHAPRIPSVANVDLPAAIGIAMALDRDTEHWGDLCSWRLKISRKAYDSKVSGQDWIMGPIEAVAVGAVDGVL